MENPQRMTDNGQEVSFIPVAAPVFSNNDGHSHPCYEIFPQGGDRCSRRVTLCLGVLNLVLLIVAGVVGVKCAKIKDSLQVSHSAATQLISELNNLRSNHSDVIKAEEEAKKDLERALQNHTLLKLQVEQHETLNDGYQRQIETLRTEKKNLQSNISAFEGSCGKCLSGWILHNSSCYFFSYVESSTVRKNWPDSRADCISHGADLVVIDNPEEQAFVSVTVTNVQGDITWQNGAWVGLTDIETEGTWVWITNVTEVEQRYWVDGEPNNHGIEGEDCGIVSYSSSNPWKTRYDGKCQIHELYWTCEMPPR